MIKLLQFLQDTKGQLSSKRGCLFAFSICTVYAILNQMYIIPVSPECYKVTMDSLVTLVVTFATTVASENFASIKDVGKSVGKKIVSTFKK